MGHPPLERAAVNVLALNLLCLFIAAMPSSQTVIVVAGAPGESDYAAAFAKSVDQWKNACDKGGATFIGIGTEPNGPASDRELLQKALTDEARQTDVPLWIVLIGHGTYDGKTAKFNLRGPDLTAEDLAGWLKPMTRPVAVIDTSSCSAPFLKALSAPNRVIITATKSGFENNYARFGQYLAEAIVDPQADLDKDGQTSLLEAFLSASEHVTQFYSAAGRLATEHALLDDNGDGLGTGADWFRGIRPVKRAKDDAALDGYRAHQFCLLYSPAEAKMAAELRAKRDQLELQVVTLRDSREKLSEDEYLSKLEPLLVEMAHIYEQTDAVTPRK
jgi:hypothetical protein